MKTKINLKLLVVCIAIPLLVGGISALLTRGSMETFETLVKPPLAPPGWLFPVVWTVLFVLMGIASYLVLSSEAPKEAQSKAISVYVYQLLVNFLWSTFFFQFGWYLFSFVWLVFLLVLILITLIRFYRITKPAGALLILYLLWITFAGYLNFAIWLLN